MKERITYFDSLRGLAIIGVVFIHSLKFKDSSFVDISIILRQLINVSVPLFLALSGFFLADKKISSKRDFFDFLKKQIPRVYIPYFVWSIIFIGVYFFTSKDFNIVTQIVSCLIFQTSGIFYFIALIIQYYILFPFIQKYLGKKLLLLSAMVSFICCIIIFFYQFLTHHNLPLIIYAGNALTWIMFFVLGMYLKKNSFTVSKRFVLCIISATLLLSIGETYLQNSLVGNHKPRVHFFFVEHSL